MKSVRASSTPRILNCTASWFDGDGPDTSGAEAEEGTAAHWLAHQLFQGHHVEANGVAPNGVVVTSEMRRHVRKYVRLCGQGQIEQAMAMHVAENFVLTGHVDHAKYDAADKSLTITDLKYGFRIVEPTANWQVISYAMLWLANNPTAAVETINLRIYQPRPFHPAGALREWTVTRAEISDVWFPKLLAAVKEIEQDPTLRSGSHCRYCWRLAKCPAAREAGMNAVDVSLKSREIERLDDEAISSELSNLRRGKEAIDDRLQAITEEAIHRLKSQRTIKGYRLTRGTTNRVWRKGVDAELLQGLVGDDMRPKNPVSPAEAQRRGLEPQLTDALAEKKLGRLIITNVDVDMEVKGKLRNE